MTIESGVVCIGVSRGGVVAIDGHDPGPPALGPRAPFDAVPAMSRNGAARSRKCGVSPGLAAQDS